MLRRAGGSRAGATRRLAVLIPFRGTVSSESFAPLCANLPNHLQQQGADVHLLAVNQIDEHPFNRAALANAAFSVLAAGGRRAGLRAADHQPFTCLAIHDVDRYPNLANRSCAPFTRSYYSCDTASPVVLHPESYTGGVLLLRPALFRAVNGFSNDFWGWGHEDNELFLRLRACGRRPEHAPELDSCMVHQDCDRCKRAKPSGGFAALRAETKSIAIVKGRMADPLGFSGSDGLSTVNFSTAARPVALPCGQHTLHVLDVRLHRAAASDHADGGCVADGGARDNGCVATVAPETLPPRLVARARQGLPSAARFKRVLGATRSRAMYNFHYEIDLEADPTPQKVGVVFRIAVCAQLWQAYAPAPVDAPDDVRYQLLWRAVASRRRTSEGQRAPQQHQRFRFSRNFTYNGHFPCELRPPPWVRPSRP